MLHFHTGPRYRLGQVTFLQQEDFDPRFLARFVPFDPGEPYSTGRLAALQNALTSSDYFSVVDVRPRRELARDHTVPVEVTVEPRKKHRFSLGLGYGTDTGPRGTLAWKNRRFNRRGHQVQSVLEVSGIRSSLLAAYEIPLKRPVTDRFAAQAGYKTEDTETSDSETVSVGVRRTRLRPGDWLETLSLEYQAEDFTVGDTERRSTMVIPGVSWARTRADNPVTPTRGSRWLLELRGAHTALGSDTDLLQTRLQGKFVRSLGQNQRLLLRGDLGLSYVSDFDALPATLRFFAGGDQSVRGYAYNSLGPEDASGEVIGGRHLVVGSVEYERRVRKNWRLRCSTTWATR